MSSKFQGQQKKKKRWEDKGLDLPLEWLEKVDRLARDGVGGCVREMCLELQGYATRQSAPGAEGEDLKSVMTVLVRALEEEVSPSASLPVRTCLELVLELVFLENSRPLHRLVLSSIKRLNQGCQELAGLVLQARIQQEVDTYWATKERDGARGKLVLGQTIASLLWLPAFQDWVRPCCIGVVRVLAECVDCILASADSGAHVAPALMQDVQDAISSLYFLVSRHGAAMASETLAPPEAADSSSSSSSSTMGGAGGAALAAATQAMLRALHGRALVREAMASAASVVWVAAVSVNPSPTAVAAQMAEGFFLTQEQAQGGWSICWAVDGVEQQQQQQGSGAEEGLGWLLGRGLVAELRRVSAVGRVCGLKGLVTALPLREALCAPLQLRSGGEALEGAAAPWTFLVDGLLQFSCRELLTVQDAHLRFHAACVVCSCVRQLLAAWKEAQAQAQVAGGGAAPGPAPGGEGEGEVAAGSGSGEGVGEAGWRPPALRAQDRALVMEVVWSNMEEPLAQTARQVHDAFDALLELLQLQQGLGSASAPSSSPLQGEHPGPAAEAARFLEETCNKMLDVPYTRKGRYLPLSSLVRAVGALKLLTLQPDLVHQTFLAMQDDMVASAAAHFLHVLLLALRAECAAAAPQGAAAGGGDSGAQQAGDSWQSWWLPDLLQALYSSSEKLRGYVALHGLPVVLGLEPGSAVALLRRIAQHQASRAPEPEPGTSRCAAVIAVLRAARSMQLIGDLDSLTQHGSSLLGGLDVKEALHAAICHSSEAVRLDCLELVCINPRVSEPPSSLELHVVSRWLLLSLRNISVGQRNKCITVLKKLMQRLKVVAGSILHRAANQSAGATGGRFAGSLKQRPSTAVLTCGPVGSSESAAEAMAKVLEQGQAQLHMIQGFMQWTCQVLVTGLYPGGPYARKLLCVELLNSLLDCWPASELGAAGSCSSSAIRGSKASTRGARFAASPDVGGPGPGAVAAAGSSPAPAAAAAAAFSPFFVGFMGPHTVALLLSGVVDSWSRLREGASAAVLKLPTPLPSLETPAALLPMVQWALELMWSPRQKESDAAVRMLKLVFDKYVVGLRWRVVLAPEPGVQLPSGQSAAEFFSSCLAFLESILDVIDQQLQVAAEDMMTACRRSLVHGPLLLLRYSLGGLPWATLAAAQQQQQQGKEEEEEESFGAGGLSHGAQQEGSGAHVLGRWVERLLDLLEKVSDLTLPVLSHPLQGVGAEDVDGCGEGDDGGGEAGEGEDGLGPDAQVLMTACWTSIKEAGLVIGALTQEVPLPELKATAGPEQAEGPESMQQPRAEGGAGRAGVGGVASAAQLRRMGELLLKMLFELKHSGAVEKAAMGLAAMATRLLRSAVPELSALPQLWLCRCFARLTARGQCRDDIIRRSSGLPFALGALFQSEPYNTPKALLPQAVLALLMLGNLAGGAAMPAATSSEPAAEVRLSVHQLLPAALQEAGGAAALLDEEPWACVHAFNCLRHAFNDSHLAVDTSVFFAEGLQACVRALGCRWWEVRNSATLCLTALVVRVLGFKNAGSRTAGEQGKRAITASEFFQRFPPLHGFLLDELRLATEALEVRSGQGAGQALRLRPSLYPVLILLSRLQPGPQPQEAQQAAAAALAPAVFVPLVQRCAAAAPLAVRALAARALCTLVTSGPQLAGTLAALLAALQPQQAAPGAPRGPNAVQGLLFQVEALLLHNCPPGSEDARVALDLCAAALPAAAPAFSGGRSAALAAAFLRASAAALALADGAAASASASALTRALSIWCSSLIAATRAVPAPSGCEARPAGFSDWYDPMHAVMLKHATRVWTHGALLCWCLEALPADPADPAAQPGEAAATAGVLAEEVERRLAVCLASGSYEVRAAALKSLGELLEALQGAVELEAPSASGAATTMSRREQQEPVSQLPAMGAKAAPAAEAGPSELEENSEGASVQGVGVGAAIVARALVKGGACAALACRLQQRLWSHLEGEVTLKAQTRCLRAVAQLHSLLGAAAAASKGGDDEAAVMRQVELVRRLYDGARGVEARAAVLRCLGRALGQASSLLQPDLLAAPGVGASRPQSPLLPHLVRFTDDLAACVQADQPELLRAAAADALAESQLLRLPPPGQDAPAERGLAPLCLKAWLLILRLLEDEDVDVRLRSAALAQAWGDRLTALRCEGAGAGGPGPLPAPGQRLFVEVVLRQVVELVGRVFGRLSEAHSALQLLVLEPGQELPELLQPQGSALVRRLFDRELDNQHEEPLLMAQLAARQLRQLLLQDGPQPVLLPWLLAASEALEQSASGLLRLQQVAGASGSWVGGVVNHPSTFTYLFRLLLPFWIVHPGIVSAATAAGAGGGAAGRGSDTPADAMHALLQRRLRAGLEAICSPGMSGPMVAVVAQVAKLWDISLPGSSHSPSTGSSNAPHTAHADAAVAAGAEPVSPWQVLFLLDEGPIVDLK